jgi:LPXTG-site transpeptidase (sortase) family protein
MIDNRENRKNREKSKNRKKRIANILIGLGFLFILIPGLLWLYATYHQWQDAKQWQAVVESSKPSGAGETSATAVEFTTNGEVQIEDTETKMFADADMIKTASKLVDRSRIKEGASIAYIAIPKLDLKLNVLEGESWANLAKGPIRVSKTARIGDGGSTLISGHRTMYAAPFHDLHKLAVGDEITVYTKKAVFSYTISEIQRVKPDDWSYITKAGFPQLVLSTCDPMFSAAKRLLIISKLRYAKPVKVAE